MLTLLHPQHLSRVWHMIKPGIEEIIDTMNKETIHETWIPEDVYASIRNGTSQLWAGDEGFMVTQVRTEGYTGLKQLYIWLAYSYDNDSDVVISNSPLVHEYAKQNGCSMIQFQSNRMGWKRRAKEFGFSMGPVTYTKRI